MNPCKQCIHFAHCFERRGKCASYKTRKEVIADIERINKAYRTEAANAEQGVQEKAETSDGNGAIHQSFGDGVQATKNI
jgi:endonuclease IV